MTLDIPLKRDAKYSPNLAANEKGFFRNNLTIEELIGFLNKNDVLSFKLLESNRIAVALKSNITICGIILGEDDLKPLIGATIFNDQGTSTITNTDGSFILENIS